MPSTSETGHAKNVANFRDLISFCAGYGATYNPSKVALSIANLQAQLADAQTIINNTKTTQTAFNNATNKRMEAFKPLKSLSTKIINALDATDASAETVKDARTINRKLQGQKATSKKETAAAVEGTNQPADKTISSSQQSYDQLMEHYSKLIELLAADSNYTPNESDLTVAANQANLTILKNTNIAVVETYTNWSNNRIERNNALYNPLTGLVNIALDIKKYVKSVFGSTSPQYKQVSKLEFRKYKG